MCVCGGGVKIWREKNIQLNVESEPDRIKKTDKYGVRDNISKMDKKTLKRF